MNKSFIYADNAATTKMDMDALKIMQKYQNESYYNPSQSYSKSQKIRKELNEARTTIAQCINADPEEIYFTSGGTESDNWAIKGIIFNNNIKEIITSKTEHHAILNTCHFMNQLKYGVKFIENDNTGYIYPNKLEDVIDDNIAIVSIMTANNEIGTIQPIKELCHIAHKHGCIFHTDAVQAIGHIKIDVKELGVDMLSASAHKFNGPKGIGFLYIKKGIHITPLMNGGSQENNLRGGTENVASIIAMAIALKKNCNVIQQNQEKLLSIEKAFIDALDRTGIDYIRNGNVDNHLPGLINISIKNVNGEMLLHRLDFMGVIISTGSACDGFNNQVSHVIKAIGTDDKYSNGTIRISFGKENTIDDALYVASCIKKIINSKY